LDHQGNFDYDEENRKHDLELLKDVTPTQIEIDPAEED